MNEEEPNDLTECRICMQPYDTTNRKPAKLNCLHTICISCLSQVLNSVKANKACACTKVYPDSVMVDDDMMKIIKRLQDADEANQALSVAYSEVCADFGNIGIALNEEDNYMIDEYKRKAKKYDELLRTITYRKVEAYMIGPNKSWICPVCRCLNFWDVEACGCKIFDKMYGLLGEDGQILDSEFQHRNGICEGTICNVCNDYIAKEQLLNWHNSSNGMSGCSKYYEYRGGKCDMCDK